MDTLVGKIPVSRLRIGVVPYVISSVANHRKYSEISLESEVLFLDVYFLAARSHCESTRTVSFVFSVMLSSIYPNALGRRTYYFVNVRHVGFRLKLDYTGSLLAVDLFSVES